MESVDAKLIDAGSIIFKLVDKDSGDAELYDAESSNAKSNNAKSSNGVAELSKADFDIAKSVDYNLANEKPSVEDPSLWSGPWHHKFNWHG